MCREKSTRGIIEMDTTSLNSIFTLPVYVYETNNLKCTCVHNSVKTLKNYTNLFMLKRDFFFNLDHIQAKVACFVHL